ncbi:MAG: hypothetical protein ABIO44_10505, partial [Saprospiraceae bacterium]
YDEQWNIISNMKCVTGQAQFVSLFAKAFSLTKNSIFEQTSILLMKELMSWQIISKNPDYHGAFPASIPIYSKYFPFQMVNWTNKFFLDACYQMRKII